MWRLNRPVLITGTLYNGGGEGGRGGRSHLKPAPGTDGKLQANVMGFAALPHAVTVNYTDGLMLLHVCRTSALRSTAATTKKTRSGLQVLFKWWPLLALLQVAVVSIHRGDKRASQC